MLCPPDSVSVWFGHPQPGSAAGPERCCCSGVVFLIIERDIKRFMVYSYRRCSSRRSIEIDTAITARLVTGCDSHMFGETKVEVAGGVPPAGWPWARLQGRDGVLGSIPEMGTGCWAGTQNPPALTPRMHTRNAQLGSQFCRACILKEAKSNFRSALRARVFYTIFFVLVIFSLDLSCRLGLQLEEGNGSSDQAWVALVGKRRFLPDLLPKP